jgi:DNA mismatch repair protein MutS
MQNSNTVAQTTLEEIVQSGVKLTPMMEQYYNVKKQFPNEFLMFRMGDFYEMFFEDAREASRLLNISLTVRGKLGDTPIPMAGIPHHAASVYIDRISNLGKKVVICEQIEDPKEAKGIVKRAVTQIVSPGMPYDLDRATQTENRFIASAFLKDGKYSSIFVDYTTGDFFGIQFKNLEELCEKLFVIRPREFISYLGQWDEHTLLEDCLNSIDSLKTHLDQSYFDLKHTHIFIKKMIPTFERDGIISQNPELLSPLGALSYYVTSTQGQEKISHLRPFKLVNNEENLKVTYSTLRGLEIFPRNKESESNSLIGFMDKTKTSMGARHLKQFFQSPLRDLKLIEKRLNLVEALCHNFEALKDLRSSLEEIRDIDRIMAKISTRKATGGDLRNLATALLTYLSIQDNLLKLEIHFFQSLPKKDNEFLQKISQEILSTISQELGAHPDKGNLILEGANKDRDRLAKLAYSAADEIIKLETKYRQETNIGNLKIRHNNISGYFIEISNSHLSKVPKHFQRRQTLVNNERYISEELENFEKEILEANFKLIKLEKDIFENFLIKIISQSNLILDIGKRIAQVDVFQSLAWVSRQENFIRPNFSKEKKLSVKGSWHPLIKSNIKDSFITHNLHLDDSKYFALITGPNMAGKTTVMREVAIIQYLAQMGCFVPAHEATLSLCDYLFSRLGASDDIIKGQSTFMVEMSETAEIIRHATDKSLIILDEIGRGTSTYDGLSIAWALVEYLAIELKAITLFATHYHELIDLIESLHVAKNFTVKTAQSNGKIEFLYELIEEGATQSFGIHVAELAGIPKQILKRSREILNKLEGNQDSNSQKILAPSKGEQMSLFDFSSPMETGQGVSEKVPEYLSQIEQDLKQLDLHNITPIQALQKLYKFQTDIHKLS